jgi:hypothetical protein
LPWSMWAMMQKLRMRRGSVAPMMLTPGSSGPGTVVRSSRSSLRVSAGVFVLGFGCQPVSSLFLAPGVGRVPSSSPAPGVGRVPSSSLAPGVGRVPSFSLRFGRASDDGRSFGCWPIFRVSAGLRSWPVGSNRPTSASSGAKPSTTYRPTTATGARITPARAADRAARAARR